MNIQYFESSSTPELQVMMIDFNAYFASVEQQLNPALRGRPLGVVPVRAESSSCIAASYEAKACGVTTGTRVSEARKLCPGIQFVVGKHAKYVQMHHRAIAVVDSLIPVDAVLSIDEMCCKLSPRWQTPAAAHKLATDIKQALLAELGECMRTSIGIGSNRFLAKTASNMQKPDGLVMLRAHDLPQALYRLKLESLTGIGVNMGARLRQYGIETVEQLCTQTRDQLRTVWGSVEGALFWDKLHGLEVIAPATETRSLGHSHVLPPADRHRAGAVAVLDRLMQKAAMRLRKSPYHATILSVHVSMMSKTEGKRAYWADEARFSATTDTRALLAVLNTLLIGWQPRRGAPAPLKVGIVLHGFVGNAQVTLPLFETESTQRKSAHLNTTLDRLNFKYGKNTLYFATAHNALDAAPMRIAFNRIPDLITER